MRLLPFLMLLLAGCLSATGRKPVGAERRSVPQNPAHVQFIEGEGVRVSRIFRTLIGEEFSDAAMPQWNRPFINLESRLRFARTTKDSDFGLLVTRRPNADEDDTAFEMVSKPVDVTAGARYILQLSAKSSENISGMQGRDGYFVNVIEWIDSDGRLVEATPFDFVASKDALTRTEHTGLVPKKAALAILHIGMDSPEIPEDGWLLIGSVSFRQEDLKTHFWTSASFETTPFILPKDGGEIAWNASVPRGCAVSVQLATAPDAGGAPGSWTPFGGEGGRTDRAFLTSGQQMPTPPDGHVWGALRVMMSTNGIASPTIRSLRAGDTLFSFSGTGE